MEIVTASTNTVLHLPKPICLISFSYLITLARIKVAEELGVTVNTSDPSKFEAEARSGVQG